jgi:hypothetical protein
MIIGLGSDEQAEGKEHKEAQAGTKGGIKGGR